MKTALMHPLLAWECAESARARLSLGARSETQDRESGGEWSSQVGVKGLDEFFIQRSVFFIYSSPSGLIPSERGISIPNEY